MTRKTRRQFLQRTGAGALGAVLLTHTKPTEAKSVERKRPNILLIVTDQQSATMLSCTGNPWVKTPAMDSLMDEGMRFEKAYAANPVCLPSRFSLLTGYYPTAVGSRHNGQAKGAERFAPLAMGHAFRKAGYETAYGGKIHLPGAMNKIENCGFDFICKDQRDQLAAECAAFLKKPHEKPFLLVASLINPHDICFQAILAHNQKSHFSRANTAVNRMREAEKMPEGVSEEAFYKTHCPPLPANHEPTSPEPKGIAVGLTDRKFKPWIREHWGEKEWRLHRWTYCRLTEVVDRQVGVILKALKEAGLDDDTLVVFTSDHGDMDAAHRMEHKTWMYEEAARIPLIVRKPGLTKAGHVDREHLVSNGLDIFPTLCDLAGVTPPQELPGQSFAPLLDGSKPKAWRKNLMVEGQFSFGVTDGRYKYMLFDSAGPEEMLCDLKTDPGELKNIAADPACADVLARMRKALAAQARAHNVKLPYPVPGTA